MLRSDTFTHIKIHAIYRPEVPKCQLLAEARKGSVEFKNFGDVKTR